VTESANELAILARINGVFTVQSVVDLLDTLDAADVRTTIGDLEQTLAVLKPAADARDALAYVDPALLRAALRLRRRRSAHCDGVS
jgi:hypothetical protein